MIRKMYKAKENSPEGVFSLIVVRIKKKKRKVEDV